MNKDQCISFLIHENQTLQSNRSLFLALNSILFPIFIFSLDKVNNIYFVLSSTSPSSELVENYLLPFLVLSIGISLCILWARMSMPQINKINYIEWVLHKFQDQSYSINYGIFHRNLSSAFKTWSDLIEAEDEVALKIQNRNNNKKIISTRVLFTKLPKLLIILWCGIFSLKTFGSW